jgi:Lrp/AsnC family transcriptional regulator, leucine-responsive regulatory protein
MSAKKEQTPTDFKLDKKDFELLKLLQSDAKITVRDLAERIHLSATPTHERIKYLEEMGVIKQYAALLNHKLLGKTITVICNVSLKEHDKKTAQAFINAVKGFKEVIECYNVSGEYDFMLKIVTDSMESFHQFFVNKLSEIKGIGQTKSVFVMDVIKQTHEVL